MKTTPISASVPDPECPLVGAGHTCLGRGGRILTGDNGCCFEGARVGAMREAA